MAGGPSANLPVSFLLMPGRGSSERKDPRDPKGQESVMIHDVPRHRPQIFLYRVTTSTTIIVHVVNAKTVLAYPRMVLSINSFNPKMQYLILNIVIKIKLKQE